MPFYPQAGYGQPGVQPGAVQPPYAQPSYAQPGYAQSGYPPPGYGQPPAGQYGMPAYPGGGYPGYGQGAAQVAAPRRPSSVATAFALWMLILLVSLASTALLFSGDYFDQVRASLGDVAGADVAVELGKSVLMVLVIISVVVSLFIYLFFGLKMYTGRNWARIVLTVLGGLSVASSSLGGTTASVSGVDLDLRPESVVVIGWVQIVLAAAAIIAMFLPASNAYFRASKAYRATR